VCGLFQCVNVCSTNQPTNYYSREEKKNAEGGEGEEVNWVSQHITTRSNSVQKKKQKTKALCSQEQFATICDNLQQIADRQIEEITRRFETRRWQSCAEINSENHNRKRLVNAIS